MCVDPRHLGQHPILYVSQRHVLPTEDAIATPRDADNIRLLHLKCILGIVVSRAQDYLHWNTTRLMEVIVPCEEIICFCLDLSYVE